MENLTDKTIRQALIASLTKRAKAPRATLEEVQVCNGSAIADVVAIYKNMHCYEIKGETDSVSRVSHQAQFYNQAFPLVSLVTTTNHLNRAIAILPQYWGIIVAGGSPDGKVVLRYVRRASRNPQYRPEVALQSLWRSELVRLPGTEGVGLEKMNKKKIAELVVATVPKKIINESLGKALAVRSLEDSRLS
jgi:hypothetical protein